MDVVVEPSSALAKTAARLFRLYPFMSGLGALSLTGFARAFVAYEPRTLWARCGGFDCAVPMNDLVGRAIFFCGDLDRKVTYFVKRHLGPGKVMVDVGTNLGLVSLIALRHVGPTGQVLSFEPSPPILNFLDRTMARAKQPNWTLERVALANENTDLELAVPPDNAGRASLVTSEMPEGTTRHIVPVRRLADRLAARGLTQVDLLKIDVEGAELGVLQGLFDTPSAPRPKVILFEDHVPLTSGCLELLQSEGYRVEGIVPKTMLGVRLAPTTDPVFERCHDFVATYAPKA